MRNCFGLDGKVALITGGARGIGLGIAEAFLESGASPIITGRSHDALNAIKDRWGSRIHTLVHDVTELSTHEDLVAGIEREMGPIEILVNNAGRHCKKPALETSDAVFDEILETNLKAVFSLTRACLRTMLPRGKGIVLNISSMAAIYGLPEVVAYSSSKAGLLGLTRTLASEYSHTGIRFNCIAPGFIDSKMFREIVEKDPQRKERILSRTPMRRFGTPADIGHAAVFLASDAASFITGICLPVDGGNSIGF